MKRDINQTNEMTDSSKKIKHNIRILVSFSDEDIGAHEESVIHRTTLTGECPSEVAVKEEESTVEQAQSPSADTSEKPPHRPFSRQKKTLVGQSKVQDCVEENECPSTLADGNSLVSEKLQNERKIEQTIDEEKEASCEGIVEESSDEWSIYSV